MDNVAIKKWVDPVIAEIERALIGKRAAIIQMLTCFLAGGHLLLEDVPGLGKTTLAKALANSLSMDNKRIQCTPDLMPADILGVTIYNQQSQQFDFNPGPIFTNILLADEINRTNPRTQSALLEAMAEGTVSIDRLTHRLPEPFFVIATQNPVEFAGTYPLPEAQLDRFMMSISLGYPDLASELKLLDKPQKIQIKACLSDKHFLKLRQLAQQVTISAAAKSYIVNVVRATRNHADIQLGASPRGTLALLQTAKALTLLSGQSYVTPKIIQSLIKPVLAHRLIFTDRYLKTAEKTLILRQLVSQVKVPDNPTG